MLLFLDNLQEGYSELQFDAIHLGKVTGSVYSRLNFARIPPFVGVIQNLMFNKIQLIDE